jgi:D-beta-D-heptose 7-phosphate kinase/D-beta-D-heptose 1-phosphate adenosyltransferase
VLVKGGDYTPDTMVGAREVQEWGGEIAIIPLTPGQSTTRILEKLRGKSS